MTANNCKRANNLFSRNVLHINTNFSKKQKKNDKRTANNNNRKIN